MPPTRSPIRRRSATQTLLTPSPKRRRVAPSRSASGKTPGSPIDLTHSSPPGKDVFSTPKSSKSSKANTPKRPKKDEEKRLRFWRTHAPQTYQDRYERAMNQRMFIISRNRQNSSPSSTATLSSSTVPPSPSLPPYPTETIELAGTTGNIYTVRIDRTPSCSCPDARKGNQCKHIIYALCTVLKAAAHLRYQLAFLSSELHEIFNAAPAIPSGQAEGEDDDGDAIYGTSSSGGAGVKGKRKAVEGDCPICFMELAPEEEAEKEPLVWCRSSCGNNVHAACFERWAQSQAGREVRCVYCRAAWEGDDDAVARILKVKARGVRNDEGYVNVAGELGLSGLRDTSTYHRPWAYGARFGR